MKVSVVNERKVLRIELEGQVLEVVNKTPITPESEKSVDTFFSNWKIVRGIPIVPVKDAFVSPSIKESIKQKSNKTPYSFPERVKRICEAFAGRERFYHKDAKALNETSVQTTYDDIEKMVAMNKLIIVDDKTAFAWKVITPDYPKALSPDDIAKRKSDIRSEEGVIRDNKII